jgi:hypothetical protein
VSARIAQRLKQKRGVSVDARAGKLGLVIRGFGHPIEAEVAVLCGWRQSTEFSRDPGLVFPRARGLIRLGRGAARPRAHSRERPWSGSSAQAVVLPDKAAGQES